MTPLDYYRTPWVQKEIQRVCHRRFVTIRVRPEVNSQGMRRHYSEDEMTVIQNNRTKLWRPIHEPTPFFEIHSANNNPRDPTDIRYFIESDGARSLEFIPEVSTVWDLDRTDTVIVDLDPKDPKKFDLEQTRQATLVVNEALCHPKSALLRSFRIDGIKYRFSGNRSFHIYIRLDKPQPFEPIREAVRKSLDILKRIYGNVLSYQHLKAADGVTVRSDYILVDIGALSRHRVVRSLWSVHAKTQRVCVPVEDLTKPYDAALADMDAVLHRGPYREAF